MTPLTNYAWQPYWHLKWNCKLHIKFSVQNKNQYLTRVPSVTVLHHLEEADFFPSYMERRCAHMNLALLVMKGVCGLPLKQGAHVVCQHKQSLHHMEGGGRGWGRNQTLESYKMKSCGQGRHGAIIFFFKIPVSNLYRSSKTTMWVPGFCSHVE